MKPLSFYKPCGTLVDSVHAGEGKNQSTYYRNAALTHGCVETEIGGNKGKRSKYYLRAKGVEACYVIGACSSHVTLLKCRLYTEPKWKVSNSDMIIEQV